MKAGISSAVAPHAPIRPKSSPPPISAMAGPLPGADAAPNAPLNQKERALFRLAMAIGARLEPEVRAYTRNALAAGWTEEELRYAARVATNTLASAEMLTTAMWVEETLNKH